MKNFLKVVFNLYLIDLWLISTSAAQEVMIGSSNSVQNQEVGANTTLNFQLFLQTQTVQNGDYLVIQLPSNQGVSFQLGRAFCTVQDALTLTTCNILTSLNAKLSVFPSGSSQVKSIQGSISVFQNPQSAMTVTNIQYSLFSSSNPNTAKAVYFGTLSNFQAGKVGVSLSSSSNVIGAQQQSLIIYVTPQYVLKASGAITVKFPNYYTNAGINQYISTTSPICNGDGMIVTSCTYSFASQQLLLTYQFTNQIDNPNPTNFYIQNFNNPITSVPQDGFIVSSLDGNLNPIGISQSLSLSGMTVPAPFKSTNFQFLDTNAVGAYSTFQISLALSVPINLGCFVKIIFPSEFTLDNQFQSMAGSSFFMQSGSTTNLNWISLSSSTNQVVFQACQSQYGADLTGTLSLKKVLNPRYVTQTGSFQIFLAADKDFSQVIMMQTSGLSLAASQLSPGAISSTSVIAQDSVVSTKTSYQFSFTPPNSLSFSQSSGSQIIITFPSTLTLANQCSISQIGPSLSQSAGCIVSGQTVTIVNPFLNTKFNGGQQISFTISPVTNPISVRNVGTILIQTQISIGQTFYLVDQATLSNAVNLNSGLISPNQAVQSSSLITYDTTSTYRFNVQFQHQVPTGSQIQILLPQGMQIINPTQLSASCYRIDTNQQLSCGTKDQYTIFINVNSAFGSGIMTGQNLNFQISSILNPRNTVQQYQFVIKTLDSSGYLIDSSAPNPLLNIVMNQPGNIQSFGVTASNQTNGAVTTYTLTIQSNVPIQSGDQISMTFPPEITLSSGTYMSCTGSSNVINQISCINTGQNQVNFFLQQVNTIGPSTSFNIYIQNVINSVSLRPSSPFTNFLLSDQSNNPMSTFKGKTRITNLYTSNISTYNLVQSTRQPGVQAYYTITFMTQNPLPPTASIVVTTPSFVSIVQDTQQCYVLTNIQSTGQCTFVQNTGVQIPNIYLGQATSYQGNVQVNFQAYNPPDNNMPNNSLSLTIYDDSTYTYAIDKITNGLNPTFTCSYPCQTCSYTNSSSCVSCPQGLYDPKFLQTDIKGFSTCVNKCSAGYTFNSQTNPPICLPCDKTCATCQSGGTAISQTYCLSCSPNFPYYWAAGAKCYPATLGCPLGTYMSNKNTCTSCPSPCLNCSNANTCYLCDSSLQAPLLQNNVCVAKCKSGLTPTYNQGLALCTPCQLPCATCYDGLPQKCLTCGNGDLQFLFGSSCLKSCPSGTTSNMTSKLCTGCQTGCQACNPTDNSICIICTKGLALLKGQCLAECPSTYQKSSDGASCELRTYPLNSVFVPFPFCILLIIIYSMILASWRITTYKTLVIQNFISATAVILFLAQLFQLLRAFVELQPLVIVMSIIFLGSNVVINAVFLITFQITIDDYQFTQYKKYHKCAFTVIMGLCFGVSLHLFRIMFGKLFALPIFYAASTNPDSFYKPLLLYSLIQVSTVVGPIILVNLYYAISTGSRYIFSNQLQMTNVEILVISSVLVLIVLYERFIQKPSNIFFIPQDNELSSLIKMFNEAGDSPTKRGLKPSDQFISDYVPLQEKLDRHKQLLELINQVRTNKNNGLNVTLDIILDLDLERPDRKGDSEPSPRLEPVCSDSEEDDDIKLNQSFPGCNRQWRDDGTDKRLQLLQWMEEQVAINALKERLIAEEILKNERVKEKETEYDNQLFDNVFFSAKSYRDNDAQNSPEISLSFRDGFVQMDQEDEEELLLKKQQKKQEKLEQREKAKQEKKQLKEMRRMERLKSATVQTETIQKQAQDSKDSKSVKSQDLSIKLQQTGKAKSKKQKSVNKSQASNISAEKSMTSERSLLNKSVKSSNSQGKASKQKVSNKKQVLIEQQDKANQVTIQLSQHKKGQENDQFKVTPMDLQFSSSNQPSIEELNGDEFGSSLTSEVNSEMSLELKLKSPHLQAQQQSYKSLRAGPETLKWIQRVKLMKTLMLDGKDPRRRPQTAGVDLPEESGYSETQKTLADQVNADLVEKQNLVEEKVPSDEEVFYKNGMEASGDESYTTLRTENDYEVEFDDQQNKYKDHINVNQRNFNIFEVLGNFNLDKNGCIINRRKTLLELNFHDLDGQVVNEYGYLINEYTGNVRSRYTFEDMFLPIQNSQDEKGELPMPYRLERFNFNPHKVLGNFDFDQKTRKPIFLRNKHDQLTDKNFRPVNHSGFLINEKEDLVDNDGRVILIQAMLGDKGNIPLLYNYSGKTYSIQDIIGQLRKDDTSKEILVKIDKKTNRAVDDIGRPVNANGYLIDDTGNIINTENEIIWNFWELVHLEPPKIFSFTQFSLNWIKGRLQRNVANFDPRDDELYDLDRRLINTAGYLIDRDENIVDQYGRVTFNKAVLSEKLGQDSEIPKVFLMDLLLQPQTEASPQKSAKYHRELESLGGDTTGLGISRIDFERSAGLGISRIDFERSGILSSKRVNGNPNSSMFSMAEPESRQASGLRNIKIPKNTSNQANQDFKPTIQDYEPLSSEHREKRKKKKHKKLRNEEEINKEQPKNQIRHGEKVKDLYQEYMNEGTVVKKRVQDRSPMPQIESTLPKIPIPLRLSTQTPSTLVAGSKSVLRFRNEPVAQSQIRVPLVPTLQNFEKTQRYASNYRSNKDASGIFSPTPFQQTGLSALGPLTQKSSAPLNMDPVFINFNPNSNDNSYPDSKSFASRAEEVIGKTRKLLKRQDSEIPNVNLLAREAQRNLLNKQIKSVNSIYGKKQHKNNRATSNDI